MKTAPMKKRDIVKKLNDKPRDLRKKIYTNNINERTTTGRIITAFIEIYL